MPIRPTRRAAMEAMAATAVFSALILGGLATAAGGIVLDDDWLVTTTTTILGGPIDEVAGVVEDATGITTSTTAPTTTSSTAPPAATTDSPDEPAPTTAGSNGEGAPPAGAASAQPQPVRSEGVPAPAGNARRRATIPAAPSVAPESLTSPVAGAAAPVAPVRPSTRSVVLLDEPAARPSLPVGGRSTRAVLDRLEGLSLPPAVVARILAPFPVAGLAYYSDDWGAARLVPALHRHEGTDIFAASGTPVIASADGVVSRLAIGSAVGGTSVRLTAAGGSYFYYAHLDRLAPTLTDGKRVSRGDVLGFVGATGNAEGGAPHLHYEIHPRGGAAVDPVPYLDQWLGEALVAAKAVQAAPDRATEALAARPGTDVDAAPLSGGARNVTPRSSTAATSPAATVLGQVQPISSSAATPLGLLLLAAGGALSWKQATRRRRRRHARRAGLKDSRPDVKVAAPPGPWRTI